MRFRFIEDRRAAYPVTILCDVLGVSPAGYYAWRSRPESERSAVNRELVDDIKQEIDPPHGLWTCGHGRGHHIIAPRATSEGW